MAKRGVIRMATISNVLSDHDKNIIALIKNAIALADLELKKSDRKAFIQKNQALISELKKMGSALESGALDAYYQRIPALRFIIASDPTELVEIVSTINDCYHDHYFQGIQSNHVISETDATMLAMIKQAISIIEQNCMLPTPEYEHRNMLLISSLRSMKNDIECGTLSSDDAITSAIHMLTETDSRLLIDTIQKIEHFYRKHYAE